MERQVLQRHWHVNQVGRNDLPNEEPPDSAIDEPTLSIYSRTIDLRLFGYNGASDKALPQTATFCNSKV